MNKNDSKQSSSRTVKSKYFTSNPGMDESLSDFQETKKSTSGPKNAAKGNHSKPRKASKRIRGQKDIRTALKLKKNELQTYSEDFNKVCKKAGIDVDSEQLQLAIALSKSLEDTATSSNQTCSSSSNKISENSQPETTQERLGKIRTTLQEYGFKVPETKIAGNTRKVRKHRKNYKLITSTETEKSEIITNKFSHILFHNIQNSSLYSSDTDTSKSHLYNLASNAKYDLLKITDTFYVNNLIEKSTSTGSLLRDWSEIPGRPVSPKLEKSINMNFSEIECSQDELDIVLSGTLKGCSNVLNKKTIGVNSKVACTIILENDLNSMDVENSIKTEVSKNNSEETLKIENGTDKLIDTSVKITQHRSCSPDIFDDDSSLICTVFLDNKSIADRRESSSNKRNPVPEIKKDIPDLTKYVDDTNLPYNLSCENPKTEQILDVTKRKSNDLMELTECVQISSKGDCSIEIPRLQSSQNTTKSMSDENMEITQCVATRSQFITENIDLTKNTVSLKESTKRVKDDNHSSKTLKKCDKSNHECFNNNNIDLTQNHDNNIILDKVQSESNLNKSIESMDLTQSSDTSDELPFVNLTPAEGNLDDTIIVDVNDYANINKKKSHLQTNIEDHIDLTQYSGKNKGINHSFFEDYNHDHSDNTEEMRKSESSNLSFEKNEPEVVDLTQPQQKSISNNVSHSNSFQESSSNVNENFLSSQPQIDNVDLTQINTSCQLNSEVIIEAMPVVCQRFNNFEGYKTCKPGKVNLTLSPIEQNDNVDDIDLTQNSNSSEESEPILKNDATTSKVIDIENTSRSEEESKNLPSYSRLGKKDNISIDYDDFDNENDGKSSHTKNANSNSPVADHDNKYSRNNSFISNCSQSSEVFEISDKELDYSMHQSKLEMQDNFAFGGISIMDEISHFGTSKKSINDNSDSIEILHKIDIEVNKIDDEKNKCKEISPIKHRRITEIATPQKASSSNMVTAITPMNSELVIKINNVTPILDYESMSTPDIHKELDKYGIKPFKRKRAIQLLTHIYNQTHPIIDKDTDDLASPPKKRKLTNEQPTTPKKLMSPRKLLDSPRKLTETKTKINDADIVREKCNKLNNQDIEIDISQHNTVNEKFKQSDKCKDSNNKTRKAKGKGKHSKENESKTVQESTDENSDVTTMPSISKQVVSQEKEKPIIKDIDCNPEDWVFQKREKAKVHSCRVPLHIAFHNYVSSRQKLREAILCYEPVEIDVIHKDLVGYGHRYDPKDLLKFLDKKCITVKTTDNEARNRKK